MLRRARLQRLLAPKQLRRRVASRGEAARSQSSATLVARRPPELDASLVAAAAHAAAAAECCAVGKERKIAVANVASVSRLVFALVLHEAMAVRRLLQYGE